MKKKSPDELYLKTNYVFIDTQSYRKAQFDWSGKTLSKIASFVKETDLKLLTTDITKKEVKKHILSGLEETNRFTGKQRGLFKQLGLKFDDYKENKANYQDKVCQNFDSFLEDVMAIEIDKSVDMDKILDDYFNINPPFSTKKQSEFPDAIVLSSLESWCKSWRKTYVVSGDPDFANFCSKSENLIHINSLPDFITKALVSKEFQEKLYEFFENNEDLHKTLSSAVETFSVKFMKSQSTLNILSINGRINDVEYIIINDVNVTDNNENTFSCFVQFEAVLDIDVIVEVDGEQHSYDEYDPGYEYQTTLNDKFDFEAEIEIFYDSEKDSLQEINSVCVYSDEIEVDAGKISVR